MKEIPMHLFCGQWKEKCYLIAFYFYLCEVKLLGRNRNLFLPRQPMSPALMHHTRLFNIQGTAVTGWLLTPNCLSNKKFPLEDQKVFGLVWFNLSYSLVNFKTELLCSTDFLVIFYERSFYIEIHLKVWNLFMNEKVPLGE